MMDNVKIYMNDWLSIHPYNRQQPSDPYFVTLANNLYYRFYFTNISPFYHKKLCMYIAAYLEDVISGLGLWSAFTRKHKELYGVELPFYILKDDYIENEVNEEDIRFIIWNTLMKIPGNHSYVNPMAQEILSMSKAYYNILHEEYESAPTNDFLMGYLNGYADRNEANYKLLWLFGRNYLTQPSVQEFIGRVTVSDKFIIPCGPLALYLYEWVDLIAPQFIEKWKKVEGLFLKAPDIPEKVKLKNRENYNHFIEATTGKLITYFNGYEALKQFLVNGLKWPNDDNYTLPQLKDHRNFVMMADSEKGVLLEKDLCECIKDPQNSMYNQQIAQTEAFKLLTHPTLCPPDLLKYILSNGYLPDAELPINGEREMVQQNADFIARHSLLYYYRGD